VDGDFEVVEEAGVGCWVWDKIASDHTIGYWPGKFFLCGSFGHNIK